MVPSIFEKHKICSNCTKSLQIVNESKIISERMRILRWNNVLLDFSRLSTMLSLNITPLKSFLISS